MTTRSPRPVLHKTSKRDQIDLLVEVARAYYEQHYDQNKIASSLGISRSQVSRYLSRARELNLVQVRVVAPGERASNLERALRRRFASLKEAVVASVFSHRPEALLKTIGRASAQYLEQKIRPGLRLCIGSGRTLYEMFNWIHPRKVTDMTIVQAMGSIGHEAMNLDFTELARAAGQAFGARVYYLNAPAILGSGTAAALAAANPAIRESLEMAHSADMYVVGIGSMQSDLIFARGGMISKEDLDHLARAGAVGDVCGRFFDVHGREMPSPFDKRLVGIPLDDLRGSGFSIGVGGGPDKVLPLLGALRGSLFNAIVTDEYTARSLLDLDQRPE